MNPVKIDDPENAAAFEAWKKQREHGEERQT